MAAYTPLTPDQFTKAQAAGYSTDQIIANEKIRKTQSGVPNTKGVSMNTSLSSPMGVDTSTPAQSNVSTVDQLSNLDQSIFPNKNLGDLIGTEIAKLTVPASQRSLVAPSTATLSGVGGDLAGDAINVGSLLAAPETGGASLGARSLLSGATGAGLSVANSLSQGGSLSDSQTWHNAIGTGLISAILPVIGEPLSSVNAEAKDLAIDSHQQAILKNSTPEEVKSYVNAAKANTVDPYSPDANGIAQNKIKLAGGMIQSQLDDAGKVLEAAHGASGSLPIITNPETGNLYTDDALSNFNKSLEEKFGHTIEIPRDNTNIKINGQTVTPSSFSTEEPPEPTISPLKDRAIKLSSSEQKMLLDVHGQLTSLANDPTVQKASDIVHNLDSNIDWEKLNSYGAKKDPIDSFLASVRGDLNHGAIRESAPAVAQANDAWSSLKSLKDEFTGLVGNDFEKSDTALARVVGNKSGPVKDIAQKVAAATGVDMVKEGGLAKFATDNFGSDYQKSLLQQRINEGAGVVGGTKRTVLSFLKKHTIGQLEPDVMKYALDLARGAAEASPGIMGAIKDFLKPPQYQGLLDQVVNDNPTRNLISTYMKNQAVTHPYIGSNLINAGSNVVQNIANNRSLIPTKQ